MEVGGGEVDEQATGLQVCSGWVLDEATWVPLPATIRIMEDRAQWETHLLPTIFVYLLRLSSVKSI